MNMTHTGIILAANTMLNKDVVSEVRELKELAESIGIEIIGTHIQNRTAVDRKSYVAVSYTHLTLPTNREV